MIVALCWTLLFSNGASQVSFTDPGLLDNKPDGLWAYIPGDVSRVRYVRNTGPEYYELGFWEENK